MIDDEKKKKRSLRETSTQMSQSDINKKFYGSDRSTSTQMSQDDISKKFYGSSSDKPKETSNKPKKTLRSANQNTVYRTHTPKSAKDRLRLLMVRLNNVGEQQKVGIRAEIKRVMAEIEKES